MLGTDFEPDLSETLRYLGYRGQELSDEMLGRIKAMSELCELYFATPGKTNRWVCPPIGL